MSREFLEQFGQRLEEARRIADISNEKTAEAIGVTVRTWNNYKAGQRQPDIPTLERICRTLKTSPDFLFGYAEENVNSGRMAAAIVEKLQEYDVEVTPEAVRLGVDTLAQEIYPPRPGGFERAVDVASRIVSGILQRSRPAS